MKNLKAKAVCVMLSASMAAMGLTGCGSDNVDGTKTAITVNDESITLGQANFMLRYQQATMYNYYSKMYSMYGMQMPSEMYDKEGDDGKTTGETFKEQSLDTIEKELLMRQHAEEYGISLTDEEKQQAKEAAQAFADKNGDDVMKKLHATVEDIQDALELYVIQTKIYDPIIAPHLPHQAGQSWLGGGHPGGTGQRPMETLRDLSRHLGRQTLSVQRRSAARWLRWLRRKRARWWWWRRCRTGRS